MTINSYSNSLDDSGKCAYSFEIAYFPKMKKPTQMGVNTSSIITHCKATFDFCISDAAEIFSTAC